jgi:hypothetical protein
MASASLHCSARAGRKSNFEGFRIRTTLTHAKPEQNLLESYRRTIEDTQIHRPRVVYDRLEIHLRENVALDIYSGRDFDQLHAALAALGHATLGHVTISAA